MTAENCHPKRRSERGQALAEFALVLPLVLLFIAGITEMSRAWNIKQVVTDAAREGARYTVVKDADVDSNDVKAKIMERLALGSIETATITIGPGADWRQTGLPMTVTVETQFKMGLIGALLQWVGGSPLVTISTDATMRNE